MHSVIIPSVVKCLVIVLRLSLLLQNMTMQTIFPPPLCFIAQSSRSRGVSKFLQIQRCNFSHSPINENSKPLRTVTSSSLRDGSTKFFDFTVIGSGVAGLRYALEVAKHGSVAVITKAEPHESNTNYAQGGVSAVLCPSDSVESHVQDTIVAGAYLCDEETVRVCYTPDHFS